MSEKIQVTLDLLGEEPVYDGCRVGAEFVADYVRNADNLLVPGVTSWTDVEATMPDPGTVVVTAEVDYVDTITGGDWAGQEVSQQWIAEYILGADIYFLAQNVLRPTEVVFA